MKSLIIMRSLTKTVSIVFLCIMVLIPMTATTETIDQQKKTILADGENWLTDWNYRQSITITNASGAGTEYQVLLNVSYNNNMQTDFDDLRFTDNDGDTLLDAWLEEKSDSNFANTWVEVSDSLETSNVTIYMYFGNSTVSNYWNGKTTFLLFDDFNDDSFNTTLWNPVDGYPAEAGGVLQLGAGTLAVESFEFFSYGSAMGARVYFKEMRAVGFGDYAPFDKENYLESKADRQYCRQGTDIASDPYSFSKETWQKLRVNWYNGSYASGYVNHTLVTQVSSPYVPDADMPLLFYVYGPDDEELLIDWVYVRKLANSTEPIVIFTGQWNEYGNPELIFPVSWHPVALFGYNAFFVFLGLIMIPASTMYIVRGGKREMSRNKLFYALIIFFVGLGLLIDGVMP